MFQEDDQSNAFACAAAWNLEHSAILRARRAERCLHARLDDSAAFTGLYALIESAKRIVVFS